MVRYAIVATAALLATACVQAQPPAAPAAAAPAAEDGCARHAASFDRLLGGSGDAARTALLAMPGIRAVRVVGPDQPVTMDYRHDRATVLVRAGKVEKITCG